MPKPLSILIIHNEYNLAGGEDSVLLAESKLLSEHGENVHFHIVTSKSIASKSQLLSIAWNFSYSETSKQEVKRILAELRPDIVHVHNFVPLITPSVFDACQESGIPVVQTIHNFRNICSASVLLRDGKICEKCVVGSHYNAALHSCYRRSFAQSLIHGHMLEKHRRLGTWATKVDRFIAVAGIARDKYIEAGIPPERPLGIGQRPLCRSPRTRKGLPDITQGLARHRDATGNHRRRPARGRDTPIRARPCDRPRRPTTREDFRRHAYRFVHGDDIGMV
jgi:hypothetical protein